MAERHQTGRGTHHPFENTPDLSKEKSDLCEGVSDLETFVGYNLKRAYVVIQADFRRTLERTGQDRLGPRGFSALSLVVQFPNSTQSGLARKLNIERSGLVAIIDDLESRAYLKRTRVPNDRRVQGLVPTASGVRAYEAALRAVRAHETRLLNDFSAAETQQLIRLLKKIRSKGGKADER